MVRASARELVAFYQREPELAARAGVETLALEAKMLLAVPSRGLSGPDLGTAQRLEGLVTLASGRIETCMASMDRAVSLSGSDEDPIGRLAGVIGVANGVLSLLGGIRL